MQSNLKYNLEANDEEYEYFHQTIASHLNVLSQYLINLNKNSVNRYIDILEKFMLKNAIYFLIILIIIFLFFFQKSNFCSITLSNKLPFKFILKNLTKINFYSKNKAENIFYELKANQIGIYAIQGRRSKMEDKFSFKSDRLNGEYQSNGNILKDEQNKLNKFETEMFAIYDGHGGDTVSNYLQNNFLNSVKQTFDSYILNSKINKCSTTNLENQTEGLNVESISRILTEKTLQLDKILCGQLKSSGDIAGATAIIAIRLINTNELIVANIGDSRGVLCDNKGNAIALSFDHKPNHPKEWKRIYQFGGFVKFTGVWRVAGILATSRALGDYPLKEKNYVIANPDILTFSLNELKPKFAIFASDGLWDTFSNKAAVKFVKDEFKKLLKNKFILSKNELSYELAKRLTLEAYKKGSLDNITVAIWIFDFNPIEKITIQTENNNFFTVKKNLTKKEWKNNLKKMNFFNKTIAENKLTKTDLLNNLVFTNKKLINFFPIEYIKVSSLLDDKENEKKSENKKTNNYKESKNLKEKLKKNEIDNKIEEIKDIEDIKNTYEKHINKSIKLTSDNICSLKDEYSIIKINSCKQINENNNES